MVRGFMSIKIIAAEIYVIKMHLMSTMKLNYIFKSIV